MSGGGGNLGFEICSNLKLGDSTVWNPESKHVEGGNLAWGLPKSQIGWDNGLES